jgi:hypothetical protein
MDAKKIKVLLIRKSQNAYSPLIDSLARNGCECRLATSNQEVGVLLDNHGFDLVLGPIRLNSDSLYPLIGRLDGSRATLFFSLTVEDGCWWLPALRRGLNCFGAPAYRPGEFVTVLDKTMEEIRSSMETAVETQPLMVPRHSGSVVNLHILAGCHSLN